MSAIALEAGTSAPLGASWDGRGVNFAVYSRHAEQIELCLFDAAGHREIARVPLPARSGDIWHGYLAGASPGLLYGYRAHGPDAPWLGHRFNPAKLLLDPYARELFGTFTWHDAVLGATPDGTPDRRDSAPYMPKCRVVVPLPRFGARAPDAAAELPRQSLHPRPPRPDTPWRDTVLYELHVRGFTLCHPEVPPALRGTVAALAEPAIVAHLHQLGVSAIELLPISAFIDEKHLVDRGLRNYWGYNPISFLAMHRAYLGEETIEAFVHTIDRLHEAGIEIVLDVVFAHTAEGDQAGPTLSFRGLDNAVYYRLAPATPGAPARYVDDTGCGNTLDFSQPAVVALALAALRYWAFEVGVDGFRFDLAPVLGRDRDGVFRAHAPLFEAIAADPDLCALKLIAEPWDMGAPGYFLGAFGAPFGQWNDRYRDGARRFWRGDRAARGEFATRLAGSADIFTHAARAPQASINFVTAHDGFTLADFTAYQAKHNEANGEHNRDGTDSNWSLNCGVEGDTAEPAILARRRRLRQSLLGTLLLSHGTPMLQAGDELSRSQRGNNNAYCQDNPTSWIDWSARGDALRDLRAFVQRAAALRRHLPLLRQTRFFDSHPLPAHPGYADIAWLRADGTPMTPADWNDDAAHAERAANTLLILLTDPAATAGACDQLLIACNADTRSRHVLLPAPARGTDWLCVLDSAAAPHQGAAALHAAGSWIELPDSTLIALVPRDAGPLTHDLGVTPGLARRARDAGVLDEYADIDGTRRQVPAQTLERLIAAAMGASPVTAAAAATHLLAASQGPPPACWLPAGLAKAPGRWALSAQIYSLRSAQSWGIGDYDDLAHLVELAAQAGADGVLLSPVHALSLTRPDCASPYAPSDRLMLNVLLISVPRAAGCEPPERYRRFIERDDVRAELVRLENAPLIDYAAVAALKLGALALLHEAFAARHLGTAPSALGAAFLRFRETAGTALRDYTVFEALNESLARQHGRHLPWSQWPQALRDPRSTDVETFAATHASRVEFFAYLQWLAWRQWRHASARARRAGMSLGLITDLALGADCDSAETWRWPGLAALEVELGAPPDAFSPKGQRWGAPPWRPRRLAELDYAPFDALLAAAMRGAGAIRLDHVMGLMRQFWLPREDTAAQGGYVAYPFDALLARVALASRHYRCAVIGEDLGNVPPGLRERLAQACILGCRVVYFERASDGRFVPAQDFTPLSAVSIATHDLPTVAGFLGGADIDEREARGLYESPGQAASARAERADAVACLRRALAPHGLPQEGPQPDAEAFARALHRFLAASGSRLAIVQFDDVAGVRRQANLPGWGDAAPNWRQRLPQSLEALAHDGRFGELASIFSVRSNSPDGPGAV
ncbi:glycogen operon protein GlgX [Pandoraea thiooxydans]|uniref:4-alpha-glucanotransferase n=1 Tax=Pandoraea thiooxydans TaxID=445709 RepID=A0A0G3ER12_9BURK|nr:glycogen debranching protein GlgX [Pandoraea thiooxydans]AKJ68444.1 4-alpha-glucanotransferase [Pandoraea thiooxydans]APR95816.1 glycogen operon protein GlgX [Pandoraea thiooxydans]